MALKKGEPLIITFFDIKKAYDRADMSDMLCIVNERGFNGKVWNLTKSMSENLTAKVKTKAGLTEEVKREKGGKQGGKLMVPLFAKMMDTLPEEMHNDDSFGVCHGSNRIASLAFVDDVASIATGYAQQERTLEKINEFAVKHQLEWGEDKCKVMEIGKHKEKRTEWKLGEKTISNCQNYKYLGEVISRDGKNGPNIKDKIGKVKAAVIDAVTCARSKIMQRIGTSVSLKHHEAVIIPTLLYGCETWTLDSKEKCLVDRIDLWALKKMFGLPPTTPTPAVRYVTGTLFTDIHIQKKQLIYLQILLQKDDSEWEKDALNILKQNDTGWAKNITQTLEQWGLELQWDIIASKPIAQWRREVEQAAEKQNKTHLYDICQSKNRTTSKLQTKTRTIAEKLQHKDYKRNPLPILYKLTSIQTRALIMGRYGMLDCRSNFSMGYGGKECTACNVIDDEAHRINDCFKYCVVNRYDKTEKIDFGKIYSDDVNDVMPVVEAILTVWDLENGKNSVKTV